MRGTQPLITALRWLWAFGLFAAVFVGWAALSNWLFGTNTRLEFAALLGVLTLLGMLLLRHCERRGWIRGLSWDLSAVRAREHELARGRERILAEARAAARR